MVYRRRRVFPRRLRKRRVYKRIGKRRQRIAKRHIFSETFQASQLAINKDASGTSGPAQEHTANIGSISQYSTYKALYDKYRILKLEWTMIPKFGTAEPNQAENNAGLGGPWDNNLRLHYRKSWNSNGTSFPNTEVEMLQLNGVRTRMVNGQRILKFVMKYPTTMRAYTGASSTGTIFEQRNLWCSFDDSVTPDHGSLTTFVASSSGGLLQSNISSCADVFCKITFEVGDPR